MALTVTFIVTTLLYCGLTCDSGALNFPPPDSLFLFGSFFIRWFFTGLVVTQRQVIRLADRPAITQDRQASLCDLTSVQMSLQRSSSLQASFQPSSWLLGWVCFSFGGWAKHLPPLCPPQVFLSVSVLLLLHVFSMKTEETECCFHITSHL